MMVRAQNNIKIYIDNKLINVNGTTVNGSTLVPLRAIFEAIGATIDWDGQTQTVTATKDETTIKLKIKDEKATKNGENVNLTTPAQIIGSSTYVPVRFIAEAFGSQVNWDETTESVYIITAQYESVYVNGNIVSPGPYESNGVTYVPLKTIVEGMGDKYEWNEASLSATVTTSSGKKVQFINNWSVMVVNGEYIPVATKDVIADSAKVKPTLKNDTFFAPLSVISGTLGYPVDTSDKTNIYVGTKPQTTQSTPAPEQPTQQITQSEQLSNDITSSDHIQKLVDYGFNSNGGNAFYNSQVSYMRIGADIVIGVSKGESVTITLANWEGKTPEFAKYAFNLYLETQGNTLYSMVDSFAQSGADSYDKSLTLDGHKVYLKYWDNTGNFVITIYNQKDSQTTQTAQPSQTGTFGSANLQKLVTNYGFSSNGAYSAFYNSQVSYMANNADINVGSDLLTRVNIQIRNWEGKTPELAKDVFNLYLPSQGGKLYQMVNDGFNGTGDQYLDKDYTMDGHTVHLHYYEDAMMLQVEIHD